VRAQIRTVSAARAARAGSAGGNAAHFDQPNAHSTSPVTGAIEQQVHAAPILVRAVSAPTVAVADPVSAAVLPTESRRPSTALRLSSVAFPAAKVVPPLSGGSVAYATSPPIPLTPRNYGPLLGVVVGLLKELQYVAADQKPSLKPLQLPSSATQSTVAGTLDAYTFNGDPFTVIVTVQPTKGTVTIDPRNGSYTYAPNAALAATGGTDSFTVTAIDTGCHPLAALFGQPAHATTVTVPVTLSATAPVTSTGTTAYSITNTSYQTMQVAYYETNGASLSPAPGTTIATGESFKFEIPDDNSVTVHLNPSNVGHEGATHTVGVGYLPFGIGVQPDGPRVYVANSNSNTVSVINTATNAVQATVGLGGGFTPQGLAVSPDGKHVYTANYGSNSVSVIDTVTLTSSAVVGVGKYPKGVAVSPDSRSVYATNYGSNSVSVIDAASNTVTATIGGVGYPIGVVASPDGTRVYVASGINGFDVVSVIDAATNKVIGSINTSANFLTVSPDSKVVYATSANVVKVIDTATNQVTDTISIPVPAGASVSLGMPAVSADGGRLFVPNILGNSVVQIDTATKKITNTVGVGTYPDWAAVSPDGAHLYVSNGFSNSVSEVGVLAPGTTGDGGVTQYTVTMSGGTVSCSAKGSNQCAVGDTAAYLEDPPGQQFFVPSDNAQQQSDVLQNLVKDDLSNAVFTAKGQPTIGYTNPMLPINFVPYTNLTSNNSTNSYTVTTTTSETDSTQYQVAVKESAKTKIFGLELAAELSFQQTTSTAVTNTTTYTQTVSQTLNGRVPGPAESLFLYYETPVYRFYGDWSVQYGNTTYNLVNVWYNTPYVAPGWPTYLAAYTCDVGSIQCTQLQQGQIPDYYPNPWPVIGEPLPINQTGSSTSEQPVASSYETSRRF